jgi:L-glyceraldehyde 3-phosphate reductase
MLKNPPNTLYTAKPSRYQNMQYQRCGNSGILLPKLSLGLWQNFGEQDSLANAKSLIHTAFDNGITHFDLANNYGPPYGAAETTFGQIFNQGLTPYRDELILSSKAGNDMWAGPYGIGGSRKYLIASCDQSLKRTGLDYFDIFYHHKMDEGTPLEETMQALDYIVRSGRALYIGLSNYHAKQTQAAIKICQDLGTPLLIHQPRYNMFDRWIEDGLTEVLAEQQLGAIVFSPLAQGLLTNKYLNIDTKGLPTNSRAARSEIIHFSDKNITSEKTIKISKLNKIAQVRGQSLAQMAIAWNLSNVAVTSCLIGASNTSQILNSVSALEKLEFSSEESQRIDDILSAC